jgi:hypothetical protein
MKQNELSKRYAEFLTEFGGDKWRGAKVDTCIADFKGRVVESYDKIRGTPLHVLALQDVKNISKMKDVLSIITYVSERMLSMEETSE